MSPADYINSLVREFAATGQGSLWNELAFPPSDRLRGQLREVVDEARRGVAPSDLWRAVHMRILSGGFRSALVRYYRERSLAETDVARIVNHTGAMICSALAAAATFDDTGSDELRVWTGKAAECFRQAGFAGDGPALPVVTTPPDERPPKGLERLRETCQVHGSAGAAAYFWILDWLGLLSQLAVRSAMSADRLELWEIKTDGPAWSCEHPQFALRPSVLPFSSLVQQAWSGRDGHTLIWSVHPDGDSAEPSDAASVLNGVSEFAKPADAAPLPPPLQPPTEVLGRFNLLHQVPGSGESEEHWWAEGMPDSGEEGRYFLVKCWPRHEGEGDAVRRALWDRELRILYRLSSSATAERTLVTMRDAGIDRRSRRYVMVLRTPGYLTLREALTSRDSSHLTMEGQRRPAVRRDIWLGLRQIAEGLRLLHAQDVIHTRLAPETVYFSSFEDPSTWRLGGFEWSVRLGTEPLKQQNAWVAPLDRDGALALDDDWYAFGMLAARCFTRVENITGTPAERNVTVAAQVEAATHLMECERLFLQDLIRSDHRERLRFWPDIMSRLQNVFVDLEGAETRDTLIGSAAPYVIVFDPANSDLGPRAREAGFALQARVDPDLPRSLRGGETLFNHEDPHHILQVRQFLQNLIQEQGRLYAVQHSSGRTDYQIVAGNLFIQLAPDQAPGSPKNWNRLFMRPLSSFHGGVELRQLRTVNIRVAHFREPLREGANWQPLLREIGAETGLSGDENRFWKFLRVSNQIELLLRCSEIFPYSKYSSREDGNIERLKILFRDDQTNEVIKGFSRSQMGIVEHLRREQEVGKSQVILTEGRNIFTGERENEELNRWTFRDVTNEDGVDVIHLERQKVPGSRQLPAPQHGWIRSHGFRGQVQLIQRRKEAIDRLVHHTYLLKALCNPAQVKVDTKITELHLPLDSKVVDDAKRAVLTDILRTRPIYALLGPPGTGKSTMVAHLLRQILEEDPSAQILVTAQAHGAVNVLLEKVVKEAFHGVPANRQPIWVRLGVDEEGAVDSSDTMGSLVANATKDGRAELLLREALLQLPEAPSDPLQAEWRSKVVEMLSYRSQRKETGLWTEFRELVRRGANIIFSTTSSGDLETLATEKQMFDWVVVEEAGKVHGYDLALPMQAGHRWVLVGDYLQLPPYRKDDFESAFIKLDEAAKNLDMLVTGSDRRLVDDDWLKEWQLPEASRQSGHQKFQEFCVANINTFREIFRRTWQVGNLRTRTSPAGALCGMLSKQYRMNPCIGELISECFYKEDGGVVSMTSYDHLHSVDWPMRLRQRPLIWLDLPWAKENPEFSEQDTPRFTNPKEVEAIKWFLEQLRAKPASPVQEIAVLSPYNQQRRRLDDMLQRLTLPEGFRFRESLFQRSRANQQQERRQVRAHTVDSFQGNQADIVIIGLTRNNGLPGPVTGRGHGLGFLLERERLNVLLSRAERMLVLVGSWHFIKSQLAGVPPDVKPEDGMFGFATLVRMFERFEQAEKAIRIRYTGGTRNS